MKKVNFRSLILFLPVFLIAALVGIFVSCDNDEVVPAENEEPNKPKLKIELSETEKTAVNNTNQFAFRLFETMSTTVGEQNIFVSPLVSSLNLALLANGSAGDTRAEILNALGVADSQIDDLNTVMNKIITALPDADNKSKVTLASSIWLADNLKPTSAFQSTCSDIYRSEIFNYVFGSSNLASNINNWCAEKTGGVIKQLITPENVQRTVFNILNATTFYGEWTQPFTSVDQDYFYLSNGGKYKVHLMNTSGEYNISMNEHLSMLYKPFGNKSFQIAFILPHEGVALNEAISSLTYGGWDNLLKRENIVSYSNMYLFAPKLNIAEEYDLLPYYEKLGVVSALIKDKADFSEIGANAYLSLSKQKAIFEMNEAGAKAVAAEISSGAVDGYIPDWAERKEFKLDRPFAFIIFEQSTGAVMFAGKVELP